MLINTDWPSLGEHTINFFTAVAFEEENRGLEHRGHPLFTPFCMAWFFFLPHTYWLVQIDKSIWKKKKRCTICKWQKTLPRSLGKLSFLENLQLHKHLKHKKLKLNNKYTMLQQWWACTTQGWGSGSWEGHLIVEGYLGVFSAPGYNCDLRSNVIGVKNK